MNYSTIEQRLSDGVLLLALNRPEKMNAFTGVVVRIYSIRPLELFNG